MDNRVIGVVGAGTMGRGIAQSFLQTGFKVIITDKDQANVQSAQKYILNGIDKVVELGKITKEEAVDYKKNLVCSDNFNSLRETAAVIEAVYENLKLKQELFKKLDSVLKTDTILATNTSTLRIDDIASQTVNKDRIIGMHFFVPAEKMKLVEVIAGLKTSDEITLKTVDLLKNINKVPVLCKDTPGFLVNRLFFIFENEAMKMASEKIASVGDIDNAVRLGLNHKMGPLELADLVGLDIIFNGLTSLYESTNDIKFKPCSVLSELVENNNLGQKTGEGFYKY